MTAAGACLPSRVSCRSSLDCLAPLRTRVKICGITRESDAAAAVAEGADALGFILWKKSARYVTPERIAEILRGVPSFVTPVAVFVNPTQREVEEVLGAWPAMTLQFHGEEPAASCAQFQRPWIKTARARPGLDLVEFLTPYTHASAWLIDAFHDQNYGGTGKRFDWSLLPPSLPKPMVLSGGLTAENVGEAIEELRPFGVDVSTGVEVERGIKDPEKIAAFIKAARRADRHVRNAELEARRAAGKTASSADTPSRTSGSIR
jgi:phosphoribosylanthranilate isomerase